MSAMMEEEIKRRKAVLVLEIIQDKTTTAEASRALASRETTHER